MTMRIWIWTLICLAAAAVSPLIGESLRGPGGDVILWELRVPRSLMGMMVGAILAITGAAYQTLFRNPLATPSTVGTTAGAALGALASVVLFPAVSIGPFPLIMVAAFVGAVVVTAMVSAIALAGRASISDVLLAGIAISLAAGALTTGLQFQADMADTFVAVRWSLGSLSTLGYERVALLAPFALVVIVTLATRWRALEVLAGGSERAATVGLRVPAARAAILGTGALGVGAAVALCGPIGFVGLLVPHLVRLGLSGARRVLIPMSAVTGAAFLPLCDGLARVIWPGRELPVGVLTAALGAPLLVWLIATRTRRSP